MKITKNLILSLYKNLYKYGQQLKYTDKAFYFKFIRNQFQSVDSVSDQNKIERLYKVCN